MKRSVRRAGIRITELAHRKLFTYADLADGEIGGLGLVRSDHGIVTIYDILLLEQEAGGAHTNLDTGAVANLMTDMMKEGKDTSELKLWWHSHDTMGAFWSGTDTATIERFALTSKWSVSIVINRRREYVARVDVYDPFRLAVDELELQVVDDKDDPFTEELRKEVKKKVDYGRAPWTPMAPSYFDERYGSKSDWPINNNPNELSLFQPKETNLGRVGGEEDFEPSGFIERWKRWTSR